MRWGWGQQERKGEAQGKEGGETPWMDVGALMAIDSLELRVQRAVRGMQRGMHRSVRRGVSVEFAEYRAYAPGDDLRHLDWRRMARTDRAFVRQYEEDSDWGCVMVVDLSGSMGFGSVGYSKADYARTLVGTLAMFLEGQGDGVGMVRCGRGAVDWVPVGRGVRQRARWWSLLAGKPEGEAQGGLRVALEEAMRVLRRPGLVVVASDFLENEPGAWAEALGVLKAGGHEVLMVEVLDEQEVGFRFEGEVRFECLEGREGLEVDAPRAREGYLRRLQAHREKVRQGCVQRGGLLWETQTDAPLEPLLREVLEVVGSRRPQSGGRVGSREGGAG